MPVGVSQSQQPKLDHRAGRQGRRGAFERFPEKGQPLQRRIHLPFELYIALVVHPQPDEAAHHKEDHRPLQSPHAHAPAIHSAPAEHSQADAHQDQRCLLPDIFDVFQQQEFRAEAQDADQQKYQQKAAKRVDRRNLAVVHGCEFLVSNF